jgi:hypothetical protein
MDRVHSAMDRRRGRVHGGPAGGTGAGNGGASSGHGTREIEVTGAHHRWSRRKGKTRRCRKGAHRSTSDSGEAARRR